MSEEVELRRRYELFIRTAGFLLRLYPAQNTPPLCHGFFSLLYLANSPSSRPFHAIFLNLSVSSAHLDR